MARSYDDRGPSARPWLIGIACRVLQERRRSVFRTLRALIRFSAGDGQPGATSSPGDHRDIESGLGQLSEVQRLVLHLSDVQGFTAEEIAGMLNVPLGTVSSRLFHARRLVRAFLSGEKS
jgi:RNA polymerase sigma-70 factor (ECF subfamily)